MKERKKEIGCESHRAWILGTSRQTLGYVRSQVRISIVQHLLSVLTQSSSRYRGTHVPVGGRRAKEVDEILPLHRIGPFLDGLKEEG